MKNTFHKEERLCSRKNIETLFTKGSSITVYPIKSVCILAGDEASPPVRALFVVPKRGFKKAHDRNKLRRRMKEAYRLSKQELYSHAGDKHYHLAFIYTGRKAEDYGIISASIAAHLEKLKTKMSR